MNLYLDTEFTGLQQDAQLISLALVDENGEWFYAEFTDYDASRLTSWHQEHVIAHLLLSGEKEPSQLAQSGQTLLGDQPTIATALKEWLGRYDQIEIWTDAAAYDWVFFCELFGGALHLPKNIFYLPFDLVTLLKIKGLDPNAKREDILPAWKGPAGLEKHNALYDAFLLKAVYEALKSAKKS